MGGRGQSWAPNSGCGRPVTCSGSPARGGGAPPHSPQPSASFGEDRPGLIFPTCTRGVGRATSWRPSSSTIGLRARGAARPLPRSGRTRCEGDSEGAGPRRPALTRLMLQCHHRHQVVGDVKKGKHGSTRKGKGQLIPRTVHHDDRPPQPKQPRRRVPGVRDEGRGKLRPRPPALRLGLSELCACALTPGAGARRGRAACPRSLGCAGGWPLGGVRRAGPCSPNKSPASSACWELCKTRRMVR